MRLGTNNCTVCGVDEGDWVSSLMIWMSVFLSLVKLNQTETEHDGSLLIKLMIFGVFIDDNSF